MESSMPSAPAPFILKYIQITNAALRALSEQILSRNLCVIVLSAQSRDLLRKGVQGNPLPEVVAALNKLASQP
jgi:hypothetical protein